MAEFGLADARPRCSTRAAREAAGASLAELCRRRGRGRPARQHQRPPQLPALMGRLRRKAYVDIDPGFTQFWHADGRDAASTGTTSTSRSARTSARPTARSRPAASTGGRSASRSCSTTGRSRRRRRPGPFTTVASWRGAVRRRRARRADVRAQGARVPQGDRAARAGAAAFEIALDIHPGDDRDRESLRGARLAPRRPADTVPRTRLAFRRYVQDSGAEFSVAQGIYVDTNSGWFSDRTVRYLASGKPALVQDTGFSRNYPVGEGLVAFRTLDEAAAGRAAHRRRLRRHTARAARALAEEYFDSDKVLRPLPCGGGRRRREPASASTHPRQRHDRRRPAPGRRDLGGAPVPARPAAARPRRHVRRAGRPRRAAPGGASLDDSVNAAYFGAVAERFGLGQAGRCSLAGTDAQTVGLPYDAAASRRPRRRRADQHLGHADRRGPDRRVRAPRLPRPRPRLHPALARARASTCASPATPTSSPSAWRSARRTARCRPAASTGSRRCQPVVLDALAGRRRRRDDALTTVGNWRGYGSVEHDGVHLRPEGALAARR